MKILFWDLGAGAAGDMLTASLYELLSDENKKTFIDTMNSLGLDGVTVEAHKSSKCGINGTGIRVSVHGMVEGEHDPHHDDSHHEYSHSSIHDIDEIISRMPVPENVRNNAKNVYDIIAGAESRVHNEPVEHIHFHEVGSMDAVADVTAVCLLIEMLGAKKIYATPVCVGYGKVSCAHGILPVPAPATAAILEGVPVYAGNIEGERCTPTGAALIRYFVDEYMQMPEMIVEKTGYGMGTRDYETANCVRAFLGSTSGSGEYITELSCNIDDMTAEDIAYAAQKLLAEGACDVYTVPIGMKKSRQGTMITVMCRREDTDRFVSLLFKYTTTIGVRENSFKRYTLCRRSEETDTPLGTVRFKISEGYGTVRKKPEYDDICRIAEEKGISPQEARESIM